MCDTNQRDHQAQADAFLAELRALCVKHGVQIGPSMYDHLQLWPLAPGEEPLHFPDIENNLAPRVYTYRHPQT